MTRGFKSMSHVIIMIIIGSCINQNMHILSNTCVTLLPLRHYSAHIHHSEKYSSTSSIAGEHNAWVWLVLCHCIPVKWQTHVRYFITVSCNSHPLNGQGYKTNLGQSICCFKKVKSWGQSINWPRIEALGTCCQPVVGIKYSYCYTKKHR